MAYEYEPPEPERAGRIEITVTLDGYMGNAELYEARVDTRWGASTSADDSIQGALLVLVDVLRREVDDLYPVVESLAASRVGLAGECVRSDCRHDDREECVRNEIDALVAQHRPDAAVEESS